MCFITQATEWIRFILNDNNDTIISFQKEEKERKKKKEEESYPSSSTAFLDTIDSSTSSVA